MRLLKKYVLKKIDIVHLLTRPYGSSYYSNLLGVSKGGGTDDHVTSITAH